MKVSIRDVAAHAGVSTGTVSNVLNGKTSVNPQTAERVRRSARELGFEPDRAAAQLRGRPARVVAALVPDLNNPFFTNLLAAIEKSARMGGFDLIVASSGGDPAEERARLAALLAWRPAGVIVVPCSDRFEARALLADGRVPFVIMDRIPTDFRGDSVTVDNVDAGRLAAEHLAQIGHRHITVVASTLSLLNIRERCEGIAQVYGQDGLPAAAVVEAGLGFEGAVAEIARMVGHGNRPTAFLALTTFATLGVLTALRDSDLRVPQDVSVVGFDDYSWMQAVTPPLTSIRQPVEVMGKEAWRLLADRIDGLDAPPRRIRLLCERMDRASTMPVAVQPA